MYSCVSTRSYVFLLTYLLFVCFLQSIKMPQVTELEKGAPTVQDGSDNTDSDSEESVPDLEDAGTGSQSQVS